MLVLARKEGETVLVDPNYRFTVLRCGNGEATIDMHVDTGTMRRRVLHLKPGQGVKLRYTDGDCEVLVISVGKKRVKLGFKADRSVAVVREEVALQHAAWEKADRAIGSLSNMAPEGVSR